MSKATGVFLVLAGIGTAALVLPNVGKDAQQQLADLVDAATARDRSRPSYDGGSSSGKLGVTGAAPSVGSLSPSPRPLVAATTDVERAPVLVAPPQIVVRNAVVAAGRVDDSQARQTLARDIQKELKRVGCYDGEMSGEWNAATRRAMKAFIDRVNAALPVDEPDHILRTMVQGHPGNACNQGCTPGQAAGRQGRCRPNETIAQVAPTRTGEGTTGAATHRIAPSPTVPHETGATPRNLASIKPAVPKPSWETTVAATTTTPHGGAVELEGRMAMGAPVDHATTGFAGPTGAGTGAAGLRPLGGSGVAGRAIVNITTPGALAALGAGGRVASAATVIPLSANTEHGATGVAALQSIANGVPAGTNDLATAAATRPHPRPAEYYAPKPEKFRFPGPSYLIGPKQPNYPAKYSKDGKGSFAHFFERTTRETGP